MTKLNREKRKKSLGYDKAIHEEAEKLIDVINYRLKNKNVPVMHFAKEVGISQPYLSKIISHANNNTSLRLGTLILLMKAVGLELGVKKGSGIVLGAKNQESSF